MAGSTTTWQTTRTFRKGLYASAAIKDALGVYGDFATIELDRGDDGWTVRFADVAEDIGPEVLASEFANYVLAGTIERKRR